MPGDQHEESGPQRAGQGGDSGRKRDWLDVIGTFAMPVVVLASAIVGGFVANSFQGQIAGTTLLSQREQAESELRASMFKSLIDPFVGGQKGGSIPLDREQLLVELLALNFHEHFEMKPLFQRIDEKLALLRDKGTQRRGALRSIARRTIDRQIAMFQKEEDGGGSDRQKAHVYSLTIVEEPKEGDEKQQRYLEMLKKGGSKVYHVGELIDDLATPDQRHRFTMVIQANWDKQEFIAEVYESPSISKGPTADQARPTRYPIGLTWFDFPLTDNTLFPDGNRFSVVLYSIPEGDPLKNMTLKFIAFPRNYFTPRERPFDQSEFLKLVGKKT